MAYATSNPPRLVSQSVGSNGGDIWVYKDGDAVSTVTAVNYVTNAADLALKSGDRVIHIDTTLGTTTDLTANSHRTSGTASGALCSAIEPLTETSIALQSEGTGTFLIDDIVTFDNDPDGTEYRITTGDADISGGGTLVIVNISGGTGLAKATAVGTGINIKSGVINLSADMSGGNTQSSSAATRLIREDESGATFTFDSAAGQVFTLPSARVGLKYNFIVTVDLTSNAYSVVTSTATAGDFFVGHVSCGVETEATAEDFFANGSTHLGISMNKTTTGGLIGTHLEVEAISGVLWKITGVSSCTATPATPFTT